MIEKFRKLIESAERILIASHTSPDPDAVCSTLLFARTLQLNYPDKEVALNLEELPDGLEFLKGFEQIQNKSFGDVLMSFVPDLLIILDANTISRITRADTEAAKKYLDDNDSSIKTLMIDHHEPEGRDETDLFIHETSPATTQLVYNLLFEKLRMKRPENYADVTLLGIISDTSRFLYDNPAHRETFRIVSDLLDAGASIETLTNRTSRYSKDQMKVFAELANNVATHDDYAYTLISEEFKNNWIRIKNSPQGLKNGAEIFVSSFLRNIEDKFWGFIIYPELLSEGSIYGVSFRAESGVKDVSVIARQLGGGGHKPAAGAKIKAPNVDQALEKVQAAIVSSS